MLLVTDGLHFCCYRAICISQSVNINKIQSALSCTNNDGIIWFWMRTYCIRFLFLHTSYLHSLYKNIHTSSESLQNLDTAKANIFHLLIFQILNCFCMNAKKSSRKKSKQHCHVQKLADHILTSFTFLTA